MSETDTLHCEVSNITPEGINLLIYHDETDASEGKQYFVPFDHFSGFKGATIEKIWNVKFTSKQQIVWPDLDIKIEVEVLENPQRFYLKYT